MTRDRDHLSRLVKILLLKIASTTPQTSSLRQRHQEGSLRSPDYTIAQGGTPLLASVDVC